MRPFHREEESELTLWKERFAKLAGIAALSIGCLSFIGCDYWPPALQAEIEMLRADLNDAWDDRQRLDVALQELRAQGSELQREVDEKRRLNDELQHRVAMLTALSQGAPSTPLRSKGPSQGLPSPVTRGSYAPLQFRHPVTEGPRVVQLQKLLRRHGIRIRIDGRFGPTTAAAVRGFQRTHGLPADGIVGSATYIALRRTGPTFRLARQLSTQRPPLTGKDVRHLQRALRRIGYNLTVDGHYGSETGIAVSRFQRARGLEPDGVVGPQTWEALVRNGR